jgi:hypothetical protein
MVRIAEITLLGLLLFSQTVEVLAKQSPAGGSMGEMRHNG